MNENGIIRRPVEGKWFNVNPAKIDKSIFQYARRHKQQEDTRLLILEALDLVEIYPEKFNKPFRTMVPQRPSGILTVNDLDNYSKQIGDRTATWVEQALEWAQRITNGEDWETICNKPDTNTCYRLIEWKNGLMRFAGGKKDGLITIPASKIGVTDWRPNDVTHHAVPLVVKYD